MHWRSLLSQSSAEISLDPEAPCLVVNDRTKSKSCLSCHLSLATRVRCRIPPHPPPPPNTHTLHCFRSWSATYYSFFTAWRYGLCVIVCVFVARPLLPKRHVQDVPLGPSDCPLSAPCCHHLPAVFPQVKRFQPEVHCFSSSSLLSVCDDTGELSFPNSYSLLLWMKKY